jgi:hypothetical protein
VKLTNRDIASAFRFTLPQVRRWAVVALGVDPVADKGKGTIREYSIDDAFKIFMVGELIQIYRMGLAEAKDNLNNLWPKLSDYSLLPSQINVIENIPIVKIYIHPGHNYDLRIIIKRNRIKKDTFKEEFVETSRVISFGPYDLTRFKLDRPIWIIGITYHLKMFSGQLSAFLKRRE